MQNPALKTDAETSGDPSCTGAEDSSAEDSKVSLPMFGALPAFTPQLEYVFAGLNEQPVDLEFFYLEHQDRE